jgi:hypothetical protein
MGAGKIHRGYHVRDTRGLNDQRRTAIVHGVVNHPRLVITLILGLDQVATKTRYELPERLHVKINRVATTGFETLRWHIRPLFPCFARS